MIFNIRGNKLVDLVTDITKLYEFDIDILSHQKLNSWLH